MGGGVQSCPALRLPLGGARIHQILRAALPFYEMASRPHLALESRVLRLQPLAARPAPIAAAGALRHDPLKAHLASPGEHERSLGHQGKRAEE
jgi:hypothetical protein